MLATFYTTGIRLREALNMTWGELDFDSGFLHVTRKTAKGFGQAWTPKDHELRAIPLAEQAAGLLTAWQTVAPQNCPYVFMDQGRWDYYRPLVEQKKWRVGNDTMNNILRKFKTLCRQAKVDNYTVHDLRRSCITNLAKRLPIHVVQQLAGHGDISTTRQYYLSVQDEDVRKAQEVQNAVLGPVPAEDLTDPKLTHSTR